MPEMIDVVCISIIKICLTAIVGGATITIVCASAYQYYRWLCGGRGCK